MRILHLKNSDREFLYNALLEMIYDELTEWDGTVNLVGLTKSKYINKIYGVARICFKYDSIVKKIRFYLRFKTNYQFPEDELELIRGYDESKWVCEEDNSNWSSKFYSEVENYYLDAKDLNWINGETFIDKMKTWNISLNAAKVRIFASGIHEGLPEWIEVNRVRPNTTQFIAVYEDTCDEIRKWGVKSCEKFEEVNASGLPKKWKMFKVDKVSLPHTSIDNLKFSTMYSLHLEGGIKTGFGNSYFDFAPPLITAEGPSDKWYVKFDNEVLARNEDGELRVPKDAEKGVPHKIELLNPNGENVKTRIIFLEKSFISKRTVDMYRNKYGDISSEKDKKFSIFGPCVAGDILKTLPKYLGDLPTYLSSTIIFIGENTEQYCKWPDDGLPDGWIPIWAIAKVKRDKWSAHFIGGKKGFMLPKKLDKSVPKWKKWKKAICNLNIEEPKADMVKSLWKRYIKGAEKL